MQIHSARRVRTLHYIASNIEILPREQKSRAADKQEQERVGGGVSTFCSSKRHAIAHCAIFSLAAGQR